MNTVNSLIIAVAIVIGFSIEPILDRVDFSDPGKRLIQVVYNGKNGPLTFCVKVNDDNWVHEDGIWYSEMGSYQPADAHALKAILEYHDY